MYYKPLTRVLLIAGLACPGALMAQEEVIETQVETEQAAAASQQVINSLDDAAGSALQAYRVAVQRGESLDIYNKQLQRLIDSQEAEIASIQRQTDEIETIETGSLPFLIEMTETLVDIVEADVPFLISERNDRIESLRELIDRADVTVGEKYRRIMEAYMIEADFGRTIEAYRGELEKDGTVRAVDFLRIGRVGLYYQTLDGGETGRWSPLTRQFVILEETYRRPVRDGLRVARKQSPPEMLRLPINAPEA